MDVDGCNVESGTPFPPSDWNGLDDWLFERSADLSETPAFAGKTANTGQVKDLIKKADDAAVEEVEECLEELFSTGGASWEKYSLETRALVKLRLRAATNFVTLVGTATGSPILFPIEAIDFMKWLFGQWWREQGIIEVAHELVCPDF